MYNNNIMNIVINKNSTHNFQISITVTNDITSTIDTPGGLQVINKLRHLVDWNVQVNTIKGR